MALENLIADFRDSWKNYRTAYKTHSAAVEYAVLHGLVERITPQIYFPELDVLFINAKEKLGTASNPREEIIIPTIKEALEYGLNFKFDNLSAPIRPDDVRNLKKISGLFGYVRNSRWGVRISFFGDSDIEIPHQHLNEYEFPLSYMKGGEVCLVSYEFSDRSLKKRLEPGGKLIIE